jgi:adenylate cyclase
MRPITVKAERVRAQLDRILASATFGDAERASRFLRLVVDRALDGRAGEIKVKESVIAIEVLGRNSSFDSKSDPIVRVEAGRLRDRLSSYYEGEGREDRTLISNPTQTLWGRPITRDKAGGEWLVVSCK